MVCGKGSVMLIKLIGASMILVSCGCAGFCIAAAQRREEKILDMLCYCIEFIESELRYKLTPLPQLCRLAASQTDGVLCKIFLSLAIELDSQISPNAESCVNVVLSKHSDLPQQAAECLLLLGKTLGRFDVAGQLKGLESARDLCRRKLHTLRSNKDIKLRNYQTLGLCAGASIVILFI